MEFSIIRSNRKTLAVQIVSGKVVVRAPKNATVKEIKEFVEGSRLWIEKHLKKAQQIEAELSCVKPLSDSEINSLAQRAAEVIPEKVRYYANKMGVSYGRITIRAQKTRWGSCSADGNLNFNCLLMLCPDRVTDSVVVHELCHRRYMNHSAQFYAEIKRFFPDYDECRIWLKKNGAALIRSIK